MKASVVGALLLGAVLATVGCAGFYAQRFGVAYVDGGRPHPSYFCADCHGVAYFDPYYDTCLEYGYVFPWRSTPAVRRVYRRDYVAIRRAYPEIGRFRYPPRYREVVRERFADETGRMPVYRSRPARDDEPRQVRRSRDRSKQEDRKDERGRGRSRGRGTERRDRE